MATETSKATEKPGGFFESFVRAWKNLQLGTSLIIWLAIIVLLLVARVVSANFWDVTHLLNVSRQASALGILAIGQTFVLITGGIDLSNGMVITVTNVLAATLLAGSDDRLIPVILLCLGIGATVGAANGLIITRLKVPPLVVTLGMYSILRGAAYVYTGGAPKGHISPTLRFVGSGFVGGVVPTAVLFWIAFTILGVILLNKTSFGRYLFAVGSNPRAARLSGVRTELVTILAYVLASVLAVVAGLIISGYVGTGSMGIGDGRNLDSIAAAVVGGTALTGGVGTVFGTAGGALFLALLFSFLRFVGLPYSNQLMVQGLILALAAYAYVRANRQ